MPAIYLAGVAVSCVALYLSVPFVPADIFDGRKPLALLAVPPVAAFAWPLVVASFGVVAVGVLSLMAVAAVIGVARVATRAN